MLRKKVLSVSPTKATLLVEESATGHLKVLRRVNTSSWSATEIEEAQRLYGVLAQSPIPVLVETDNVVFQSAYLNVVTPHFSKGELASFVRASPQQPPSDAQIARWVHVIALGVQSVHRLGFVHGALKLSKVYLTDDRGAAGIVLGSPLPLPLYREALDNARQHAGGSVNGSGENHRHFYNDDERSSGAAQQQQQHHGGQGSTSMYSNISTNSLELNYPPEVLHSAANRELRYTTQSDVWHLGAMLMTLSAAHGQLQRRSEVLHSLINDMCDDDPDRRVTIADVIRRLVLVQSADGAAAIGSASTITTTITAQQIIHLSGRASTTTMPALAAPPGELQPSSIDRSEAYTPVDEEYDENDRIDSRPHDHQHVNAKRNANTLAASSSPDPEDPRSSTQRFVPPPPLVLTKKQQPTGAAVVAMDSVTHSNVGIVLTPRSRATAPKEQGGAKRTSSATAASRASAAPTTKPQPQTLSSGTAAPSQRTGRVATTPLRAHSKPAGGGSGTPRSGGGITAVRQAQQANSAYLIHAFERQEAEQQRRRDEQAREAAKRREELATMKEAADAVHRQHMDNLRRIHKKHENDHRGDIRKSIKLWQQRQGHTTAAGGGAAVLENQLDEEEGEFTPQPSSTGIVLDDGHGVMVFAKAEAPPARLHLSSRGDAATTHADKALPVSSRHRVVETTQHDDDSGDDPNVNYVVSPRRTVKRLPQQQQQQRRNEMTTPPRRDADTDASLLIAESSHKLKSITTTTLTASATPKARATHNNRHEEEEEDEGTTGDNSDNEVGSVTTMTTTRTTTSSSYVGTSDAVAMMRSPTTPSSPTVGPPSSSRFTEQQQQQQQDQQSTAFEITPPRKRRLGGAVASAPTAAGGVLPFQHHQREEQQQLHSSGVPTRHLNRVADSQVEQNVSAQQSRSSSEPRIVVEQEEQSSSKENTK
ncbi:Hypothetical protein, putative, partial [Bodo saltans]